MDTQNNTLIIREYPWVAWVAGLILLGIAGFSAAGAWRDWTISLITGVAGLLFFIFAAILVVQADRTSSTLTIRRTSLLRHYERKIPISNIAALQVESQTSVETEKGRGTTTTSAYRIVVITKDNETIPFRNAYTSGLSVKEARAKKLREFLGVEGRDMSPGGMFKQATGMAQGVFQEKQAALTGPEAEEHVTEGVHWKVQTVAFGGTAFTRWFSPDQQCNSGFIFLAQKVAGQSAGGGLLGGLNKILFHQLILMAGFGSEDTPGLDSAELLPNFDARLDPYFSVFTSDPAAARQTQNPWAIDLLVDWATRYPLKQMQTSRDLFGQLIVMISPLGTYVSSLGNMIPEAMQELTNLGVALVKGRKIA